MFIEHEEGFLSLALVTKIISFLGIKRIMTKIGVKEVYLLAYNATCAVAWALVLRLAIQTLMEDIPEHGIKDALANVYATKELAMLLMWAQLAAILEILHSAVGLVRSPVIVTFMQVSSRVVALFALVNSPNAQGENTTKAAICFLLVYVA